MYFADDGEEKKILKWLQCERPHAFLAKELAN